MKPYRAAVIGLGRMGSTFDDEMKAGGQIYLPYCHTPTYVASPHTELVAGVDPHEVQRQIYGERWDLDTEHLYSDYREMLECEKPDIVSVCTTARGRAEIVETVARSGVKAIWSEKPLAISLAEADSMVQVCADNSVAIAVNCARRYNPHYAMAHQLIDEGQIGDLLQITHYASCHLSHNGSHAIDTMCYYVDGGVDWVFGEMESDEEAAGDNDLAGNGYLAFEGGVRGYLRAMSTGSAVSWDLELIGTEGSIRLRQSGDECELTKTAPAAISGRPGPARIPFPSPTHMQGMGLTIMDDLVEAVSEGREPRCSGRDGLAALEIAMALRESHRRGGTRVDLPLQDRSLCIHSAETREDDTPARIRRERAQS
jgi:predicted dehydrogenase